VQETARIDSGKEAERRAVIVTVALAELVSDSGRQRHFISQLPRFLKARALDDARPAPVVWSGDAFVQHIASALGTHAAEAEITLHAVYAVLQEAISPGQISEFENDLPLDLRAVLRG